GHRVNSFLEVDVERAACRDHALFDGNGRKRWADNVTRGINSLGGRVVLMIDYDASPSVEFDASLVQPQPFRICNAAGREQNRVGMKHSSARKHCSELAV